MDLYSDIAMKESSSFRYEWQLASATLGLLRASVFWGAFYAKQMARRILVLLGVKKAIKLDVDCSKLAEKKHLRVMFVSSDNSVSSGAFRSMATLASIFRKNHGIDAFIILPGEGNGTELLNQASIPCCVVPSCHWTIPMDFDFGNHDSSKSIKKRMIVNHYAILRLRQIIRMYQVDLVHVNTTWTYVGAVAALAEKIPYIWHLREFLEEDQGRTMWSRPIGNTMIAKADAAIAISASLKEKYSSCVDSGKLAVIMNGIDDSLFPKTKRQIFKEKPYTFIMLGNFRRHKGHLEFAKACAELHGSGFRDFRVWFVGTGDDDVRSECMKILESAGMSEIVTFLGFQKHPERFLQQADVAFMCSRSEAFGRVTVEAMMSGCLVIGAATAATAELIRDGETGLLYHYTQGGASAMVEKMKLAVSQPERMRTIAAAGRDFAFRHFTAKRNAEAVAALYRTILPSAVCCRSLKRE